MFRRVLDRISCREYEIAADAVPRAFGLAKSSVSRRFIRASAQAPQARNERRHDHAQWLARPLKGESFMGNPDLEVWAISAFPKSGQLEVSA